MFFSIANATRQHSYAPCQHPDRQVNIPPYIQTQLKKQNKKQCYILNQWKQKEMSINI